MYTIKNFTIRSKRDNLPLSGIITESEHPKAILQLSHGMCEHKERYLSFMKYMTKNNYTCIIHDHRGHGKSILSRSDLGYFYEDGGQALVDDLHQVTTYAKELFPKTPLFLFGHSMGSLGVRAYIKEDDSDINGLLVCGSPSNNKLSKVAEEFLDTLLKLKGEKYKSNFFNNLFFSSFTKPFKKENLKNSWLTTDKNVVNTYNTDEYCNFIFSLNGFKSLFFLLNTVYSKDNWTLNNKNLPIKFISGEKDPCLINKKEFIKSVDHLKNIGYENVDYKLFKDMRHEILNEINKEIVYEEILNTLNSWLDDTTNPK